jgi:hypothetical protein
VGCVGSTRLGEDMSAVVAFMTAKCWVVGALFALSRHERCLMINRDLRITRATRSRSETPYRNRMTVCQGGEMWRRNQKPSLNTRLCHSTRKPYCYYMLGRERPVDKVNKSRNVVIQVDTEPARVSGAICPKYFLQSSANLVDAAA